VIKKAVKSDIQKIIEIERSSFIDPWNEQLFKDALDSIFVFEKDRSLAGYIVFESVLDEGHITNLAVAQGYQRQGVASKLIEHVLDIAKGLKIKQIFLEVRQSNEAAKKLYQKFGFKEIGKRKGYYPNAKEDAIIYRKGE